MAREDSIELMHPNADRQLEPNFQRIISKDQNVIDEGGLFTRAQSTEISNAVDEEDVPPNGGYGWVCVFCVFWVNAHTWGINSVSGANILAVLPFFTQNFAHFVTRLTACFLPTIFHQTYSQMPHLFSTRSLAASLCHKPS
jgi:hypothetical protein